MRVEAGKFFGMNTRESNRTAMPQVAQWVDDLRAAFGPGVRVTFAHENGRSVGQRDTQGVAVEPPPYPTHALARFPKELRARK